MAKVSLYTLVLLATWSPVAAQNPFSGLMFGSSANVVRSSAKDVSNPQSWEETAFEIINPPYTLFKQFKPTQCTLTYHNDRLFQVHCEFSRRQFEAIYTNIVAERQVPKDRDFAKADRSATWYGEFKDGRFENVLNIYQSGTRTVVSYSDETQKDFRFADLFKGMVPWLIFAFVGLFGGYMLFGWLMTSKCPKCKKRKLKITGKTYDNPQDYDPGLFSRDVHWDEVYHYKCAACGYEKNDRYSGFWSWRRGE
ncbi:MAG TPA: hypothetical protein PKY99_11840 [Turneriella sp.]|nr:hypothetical protein [Turneriella sp.]